MNNLKQVLGWLKSEKLKERQEGISSLRVFFSQSNVIEKLDPHGDGRAWLVVFQALFTCIVSERATVTKKGSASTASAAERRLKDGASALRWLTERSVSRWGMKVAKPLVKHLRQGMVQNRRLFEPVALDYVKTLRVICSYQPHLDHLMTDETQWTDILSLSFNVVLGDELTSSIEKEEEGMSEAEVSSALSEEEEEGTSSRKRKRKGAANGRSTTIRTSPTASPEQIEFASIVSILLQSPRAKLISPDRPTLAGGVLNRLVRFFQIYRTETSAHLDAMKAVNATVNNLSLNARDQIINFAALFWDHLLGLWATKNRSIKEEVLVAAKLLYPYVTHPDAKTSIDQEDAVSGLLKLLQRDRESRWSFDELSIDNLRFEISEEEIFSPFIAKTFRRGYNFSPGQMIAWTILELQADCVVQLYLYIEHGPPRSTGKRAKIEDPVRQLLSTIQSGTPRKKAPVLQCLLFLIDRHWDTMHLEIRAQIVSVLRQMIAVDDTTVQSWVFCCFAAVGFADTSSDNSINWDGIWGHTVRRTSSPAICRMACHASHVLLLYGKVSNNRALAEIEVLSQDITVQGPAAAYDSVCSFLALCMKTARQDTRLYRMHVDDKVLAWFIETWSGASRSMSSVANRHKREQYTILDILRLLEGACGLKQESNLQCLIPLPDHPLVEQLQGLISTNVIREYLLRARFPKRGPVHDYPVRSKNQALETSDNADLVQPEHRERKTSAFLLKLVESVNADWISRNADSPRPTAESIRQALDLAVLTICFESTLVMNGIRSNRRSILSACNLIKTLTSYVRNYASSYQELTTLLSTLIPLISSTAEPRIEHRWDALLSATSATGTKYSSDDLESQREKREESEQARRTHLQHIIWRSTDVQDGLAGIISVVQEVLKSFVNGKKMPSSNGTSTFSTDDRDEFGPIRTSTMASLEVASTERLHSTRRLVWISMTLLLRSSVLQCQGTDASMDKFIIELICDCSDDERFIEVLVPFLWHARQKNARLTGPAVDRILQRIEGPLMSYNHSRSILLSLTSVDLLISTISVWLGTNSSSSLNGKIHLLIQWLINSLKTADWRTRDAVARFLDLYLTSDPNQQFFITVGNEDEEEPVSDDLPATHLTLLLKDDDIRVRFTASKACAKLFSTAYVRPGDERYDPMTVYGEIKEKLCTELARYEHMLTRFVCLANIIIVSSAVRRGPYWHLIEICLYGRTYEEHVLSILTEAAKNMGIVHFSELFEAYASQVAYSVRISQKDVFSLPANLLGYRDRRECAEAIFLSFSPTNLLADIRGEMALHDGQEAFIRHCKVIEKTPEDGLRRCFADTFGYQVVFLIDEQLDGGSNSSMETNAAANVVFDENELLTTLQSRFATLGLREDLKSTTEKYIDRVIFTILRTCGEMDYHRDGIIAKALEGRDQSDRTVRAFRTFMKYRGRGEFEIHSPNLPALGISVVVTALNWITGFAKESNVPATTYHILYHFFTAIMRCILVNEQLRLLTSLCVWISLVHSQFKNATLLKVLMNGAVSLLPQHDLSACSQGILEWVFFHVKETRIDLPHIVEALIRVCSVAQTFRKSEDKVVQATGVQLKTWIEAQVVYLCEVEPLRQRIAIALAMWPEELVDHLREISANLTLTELSAALDDPYLSSNKFKLVRPLSSLATEFHYDKNAFAGHDFWRLKDCIPQCMIPEEEIDAFTALLIRKTGYIRSNSTDQHYGRSIAIRHQKLSQRDEKGRRAGHVSVKRPIIMTLLDMLADQSPSVVDAAYCTLRSIANIETLDAPEYGSWPSEYRGDIACLVVCPTEGGDETSKSLKDLLQDEFLVEGSNFVEWISGIAIFLSSVLSTTDAFFAHLGPVLQGSSSFSEQMFPVLVYTLLRQNHTEGGTPARTILSEYFKKLLSGSMLDKRCHRAIVNLVLHLRNYKPENVQNELQYNHWLDLDYVLFSQSAIECGAYTTSLLFLELACDASPSQPLDTRVSERILYEIYSHIEEPDGFYGIQTQNLHDFLVKRFHHEEQWEKAFQFHGARYEAANGETSGKDGIVKSLQSFGFNHLALVALQCAESDDQPSSSSRSSYQLGWRTESWDLPDPPSGSAGSSLYTALRAVHREREEEALDRTLRGAFNDELQYLRKLGNEDLAEIHRVTRNLMSLAQIRLWRSPALQGLLTSGEDKIEELDWGDLRIGSDAYDFQDFESIAATRISLIHSLQQKEQREQIGQMQSDLTSSLLELEKNCLIQLSEAARDANQAQVALNSIIRASRLNNGFGSSLTQEYANVLWLKNEQKFAVEFLKREVELKLGQKNKAKSNNVKDALTLAKLGEWTNEACLEKPDFIQKNYFSPAIALLLECNLGQSESGDIRASIFHKCAMFAEQQYQTIVRSPDLVRLKVYSERKRQELKDREESIRRSQGNRDKIVELSHHQRRAKALFEQDTAQFIEINRSRDTFLHQAIQMLSLCLEASDSFDGDAAIRLCSLWFANFAGEELSQVIPGALKKVPSRKFVFLAHQLSARLSSQELAKTVNQQALRSLISRMCTEHPFHSLYQVYALHSASQSPTSSRRRSSTIGADSSSQLDRAAAASEIFQQLENAPDSDSKVRDVKRLCDAYLEWAKHPIKGDKRVAGKKKGDKEPLLIPLNLAIRKIADLRVPVTTAHTPLDPTMRYEDCVWIHGYASNFTTAGGVNLPKISYCYGSDGKQYKQLFKGEGDDDLRQDAVMEQVFELCNQVLSHDRETRKRSLHMRSYKVVPLAPQAGLLEFVTNTIPMQSWLSLAHNRYHPSDMHMRDCTYQLSHLRKENGDTAALVDLFRNIRLKFRPVLRHFFTERHKVPQAWFEMRLNYSRSVSVSSIIGHVLGLGDRHISNILLDTSSGEVVHIDLGIAFEQGKILPIAERVPFRLTADMVDGFGMSGTEGVFRRCAEQTLRVLRDGSDVIKTVLEVFKYDPLHSWTASAVKVRKVQADSAQHTYDTGFGMGIGIDMDSGMEDEAADRALNGVARKLDKSLSVEYTVNELITEATDESNLAQMFAGWSPFC